MGMEVKTALDKFYAVFDNSEMDDVFFEYNGLSYQLSYCGHYIWTENSEDGNDPWEYCFGENGKELFEAVLNSKVNQARDKSIREILAELPPEAIWLG